MPTHEPERVAFRENVAEASRYLLPSVLWYTRFQAVARVLGELDAFRVPTTAEKSNCSPSMVMCPYLVALATIE